MSSPTKPLVAGHAREDDLRHAGGAIVDGHPLLVGGVPRPGGWRSVARRFVVEGDEYDSATSTEPAPLPLCQQALRARRLIRLSRDLAHVKSAFAKLLALLPAGAPLVACGDFPHVLDVVAGSAARIRRFGVDDANEWRVTDLVDDGATHFTVRERGRAVCRVTLQPPGAINARNALGVLLVAVEAGVGWNDAAAALASSGRAAPARGRRNGARRDVIDDFAHHPTAVAGTLAALRRRYPGAGSARCSNRARTRAGAASSRTSS
jgi:UDP-N-acetylmuramate-alanine ligase